MHHTDYHHNLRFTTHIAAKYMTTNATSGNSTQNSHSKLLPMFVNATVTGLLFHVDQTNTQP